MKPLSNLEINKYFRGNHYYGGTVAKNALAKHAAAYGSLKHIRKFWIVNMDDSTGPGTHWVLVSLLNPEIAIYFDPFAVAPPIDVLTFMKKWRPDVAMNEDIVQDVNSTNCGYFCIYVANELCKGRYFMDIMIDDFSPRALDNERMIEGEFDKVDFEE